MIRKIGFILLMGIILVGASTTSTPIPVLFGMGCLILFALSVAMRGEKAG